MDPDMDRTLTAVFEQCDEGGFHAYIKEIPGVHSEGESIEEAQGNLMDAFRELLEVLDDRRDPKTVNGLAFRQCDGSHWLSPERQWLGPNELPAPPYRKIEVDDYLHPTVLGRRSGVYQASIGCPYACNFCGCSGRRHSNRERCFDKHEFCRTAAEQYFGVLDLSERFI